jgi:hypothetical protein
LQHCSIAGQVTDPQPRIAESASRIGLDRRKGKNIADISALGD